MEQKSGFCVPKRQEASSYELPVSVVSNFTQRNTALRWVTVPVLQRNVEVVIIIHAHAIKAHKIPEQMCET